MEALTLTEIIALVVMLRLHYTMCDKEKRKV